jgi:hypothetical protein
LRQRLLREEYLYARDYLRDGTRGPDLHLPHDPGGHAVRRRPERLRPDAGRHLHADATTNLSDELPMSGWRCLYTEPVRRRYDALCAVLRLHDRDDRQLRLWRRRSMQSVGRDDMHADLHSEDRLRRFRAQHMRREPKLRLLR